ncbi:PRC-barrel domain-containing protein [[Eubacterium] cellulosolvens]
MLDEITSLYEKEVYTHKGLYLGRVYEIMVDVKNYSVYELILSDTNPSIVENSRSIGVPYRWVSTVSEIVVLKYFPGKIHVKPKPSRFRRKRRKLRVIKRKRTDHGISRMPWDSRAGPRRTGEQY